MKHKSLFLLAIAGISLTALLSGCLRDECESTRTFVRFDPVYKQPSEVRAGMSVQAPRALHNTGKIYVFGQYLFINERNEGIHVIDNADPANPKPVVFWSIPGNGDMAIRGQYLYANQYIDLLTIDISNFQNPQIVCRSENAFQSYGYDLARGYLVDYLQTEITETVPCNDGRWGQEWFREGDVVFINNAFMANNNGPTKASNPLAVAGIGGSYARFTIVDNYLYTVDNSLLYSWSVASACPARLDSVWVGWNIETIFPWKDRLFVGSQIGVFIFNNSNPQHPVLETQFSHASGCDPVVCDDNYAYVTIHDGTTCNGTFNQLDIIDIDNLPSAELKKSYQMKRPFGLSVTNNFLYVCDEGLKIFDKTNPLDLKEKSHIKGFDAYDIIALSESQLLVIGADGFYQFNATDPVHPIQLSMIPVSK